ncbi:multiheme c-type cytochrome [Aestuariibacter sp. A3R04]|uniref:multiheme c-type cytochrome n=1 Tax=Aestuariibacter sp. A3R04 TaxID=2841571 RepID=UPI001C086459|nr:tetratricopeptide repeat protein [Aestuariibacter sp. A3R04]MBU3021094.1 hypothetical protein [Aestuariibacter sp. A3R04]
MKLLLRLSIFLFLIYFATDFAFAAESDKCVNCHRQEVADWAVSDHGKAMLLPSDDTVVGDFNQAHASHFSQQATFFKKGNKFLISFTEGNKTTEYEVSYTFGHYPLQQYLIATKDGKYQVFPFSWDSRPAKEGGQRWFPNYPEEDIASNDRLHWLQPMQNWNGMCADCHSSGLKRQFDIDKETFNTTYDDINVSCASCHGDMTAHADNPSAENHSGQIALSLKEQKALGQWLLSPKDKIAHWEGEPRNNKFMDTCYGCHSLRSPLTDGIDPSKPYLDQFTPSLLTPPLYHANGHIKEEVYVYGSFQQSKMFEAGVNCVDCHNPHTMKIKVEGNGLCLQCHSAEAYQQETHTHHPLDSTGSECVSCHMPQTTYMSVDARRDHSFSIPNPAVSASTGAPNACLNCHEEQSNDWSQTHITTWFKDSTSFTTSESQYVAIMHGRVTDKNAMLKLASDTSLPIIKRATLLAMLPRTVSALNNRELANFLVHDAPLIRLAAAQAAVLLPDSERPKSLTPLLSDPYRAVRVAAVNQLVGSGLKTADYHRALSELFAANDANSWRGEGNLNQSLAAFANGDVTTAEQRLQTGISVDPYFEANYVNLAELYRARGETEKEEALLKRALDAIPNSDILHYSMGMYLVRNQEKVSAVQHFKQASRLAPANPRNWYIYALGLDSIGKTKEAIAILKRVVTKQADPSLIQLGSSLAQKQGDTTSLHYFMRFRR